jgi:hypothetical protein
MILTTILTSVISIIFFRNQIKVLKNLSELAEKFGRGQDVSNIRPSGSQEIRSLTISFIKMKERVMRQISQRTDMLSAVSHDLRTPLTRMKLQLEMLKQSPEIDDLKNDVHDMEKLVNEYLDFARGDDKEKINIVNINKFLIEKIISYYVKMNHNLTLGNIIITDQARQYMKAKVNYYNVDDKRKANITLLPTIGPLGPLGPSLPLGIKKDGEIFSPLNTWPYSPSITYDTKEYPSTTFIEGGFMPRIIPINSTIGGPIGGPIGALGPLVSPLSNLMLPNLAGNVYRY